MSLQLEPHVVDEVAWLADALAAAPGVRMAEVGTDPGLSRHVLVVFEDGTRRAFSGRAAPRVGVPAILRKPDKTR